MGLAKIPSGRLVIDPQSQIGAVVDDSLVLLVVPRYLRKGITIDVTGQGDAGSKVGLDGTGLRPELRTI